MKWIQMLLQRILYPQVIFLVYEGWPSYDSDHDDQNNVIAIVRTESEARDVIVYEINGRDDWIVSEDGLDAELKSGVKYMWTERRTLG